MRLTTLRPIYRVRAALIVAGCCAFLGCHLNEVLKVPAPAGATSAQGLANQSGAEAVYTTGETNFFGAVYGGYGVVQWTGLLSDEFVWSAFSQTYYAEEANVDARMTLGSGYPGFEESGDYPWESTLSARTNLLYAIAGLQKYEPPAGESKVGEAYALIGYAELIIAESYCGGTPLSQILPGGGFQYGVPLSDDSLLGVAEAHFDSAMAHAAGSDSVLNLAAVGLGRTLLDRGRIDSAGQIVENVPTSFVFSADLPPNAGTGFYSLNLYANNVQYPYSAVFNVANRKGENGLNFLAANDPRLTFNTSYQTADSGIWYLPTKFNANFEYIPMATGVEAALIQAEAALQAGNVSQWLTDINTLRNGSCTVTGTDTTCTLGAGQVAGQTAGLPPLTDPGTDTGRVSLMFRERAFWLYGTGSRLGDLRRLMKSPYNRDSSVVFPHGPYPDGTNANLPSPIPTYGLDVDLTLPSKANISSGAFSETNPNYKGCTTPTTQP